MVAPSTTAADGAPPLGGELVAVAVALLREPPGRAASMLQEARFPADDDGSLEGAMRTWARDVLGALERRPILRADDGGLISLTEDSVRWALGVAAVNTHGRRPLGAQTRSSEACSCCWRP